MACLSAGPQTPPATQPTDELRCEILIAGGTFGGVAAALGAKGRDLWVVEDSDWIGGQATSQGVSALDEHRYLGEHRYIEWFGGTRTHAQFRRAIRARHGGVTNPGGGWVSRLCFLPRTGVEVLEEMLHGTRILREARIGRSAAGDRVTAVVVRRKDGTRVRFLTQLVLDATDTGELLPRCGAAVRTGAEARAETGEPNALAVAD